MKIIIQRILLLFGYRLVKQTTWTQLLNEQSRLSDFKLHPSPRVDHPFNTLALSSAAMKKLIEDHTFKTVIDIGAGGLEHSEIFHSFGKKVTAIDFGNSIYCRENDKSIQSSHIDVIIGDFMTTNFKNQFDCVWASHVLEHQPNVDIFLKKINSVLKDQGVLAITVPPLKHEIVGGHVSLWNAGLLLYRLVLAGFDCRDASVLSYDYNISVIVKKQPIEENIDLQFDCGDIRRIRRYLPPFLHFKSNENDDPFDGNIISLNW